MNSLLRMSIFVMTAAAMICIPALADDVIQSRVMNVTPTAIVTPNGQGSYSPGTIQILYTLVAPQFTAGTVGSFTLNLEDIQKSTTGQFPTYPTTLTLTQDGSTQLTLTPQASSFSVSGETWTGSTVVTVSIPDSVVADSSNAVDGTTLVGNLNVSGGSHLGTNTTIQVKIKLVVPKVTTCLNVYHFATDEAFSEILTSVGANQNKKGIVVGSNPGSLSDNTLVVNTCNSAQSFDVNVVLDPNWETVPNNNPGNAVFTYNTAGEIDETSFNLAFSGTQTAQHQNLCIPNVSVASGDTFLMTVHMGIITGGYASSLGTVPFDFTGGLYAANTNCSGAADLLASPAIDPYSLPFSLF